MGISRQATPPFLKGNGQVLGEPLITCDARDRKSSIQALQKLVSYTLSLAEVSGGAADKVLSGSW